MRRLERVELNGDRAAARRARPSASHTCRKPLLATTTPPEQKWPQTLWIVRHGQSAGNVARDAAEAAGLRVIDIAERDVDVPLSALGERQARALGEWFGAMPAELQPDVV